MQRYNLQQRVWEISDEAPGAAIQPLPLARSDMGRCIVKDRQIFLFGGAKDTPPGQSDFNLDVVSVFSLDTLRWETTNIRMNAARHAIDPVARGEMIFVVGGNEGGSVEEPTSFHEWLRVGE